MKQIHFITITSFLLLLISCTNELPVDVVQPIVEPSIEQEIEPFKPYEGEIKLGRKLENPYSVSNMRKAIELLPKESRGGFTPKDIQPTHLYVKFKPANVDELDAMFWSNDDIHFYSFPLDYERESGGSYYRDPSLPKDVPTYYYASIPIERSIPNECDYEILEELYIPDELTDKTRTLSPLFINAIVKKSFELTNNDYTQDAVATRSDGQTRAPYTYNGTIRVWDDLVDDYVPVPGAYIKCTRWFTTVTAVTNTDGYYSMTRESKNEYSYSIYWERDNKYDIRDGELEQAATHGPKQVNGWSLDISVDNGYARGTNFATITRAAYRYFYGNRGGIYQMTPPSTGDLKICYKHEHHNKGYYGLFRGIVTFEIVGDIWIYGMSNSTDYIPTHQVFTTSIHEMAHANEYNAKTVLSYSTTDDFIHESWAIFVQAYITYLEYGELDFYELWIFSFEDFCENYYNDINIYSAWYWNKQLDSNYSGLFIDLYDDYNQQTQSNDLKYPFDNIRGYSVSKLNTFVNQSQNLSDLLALLKSNKPSTVTDTMLDTLIDFYNTYKPE